MEDDRNKPAPGRVGSLSRGGKLGDRGAAPADPGAAPDLVLPRGAAAGIGKPPPDPAVVAGVNRAAVEPPAGKINAVVDAILNGEWHEDAFVQQGIPWSIARGWLKLGEASVKLAAEDGRPLTWQGALYQRVTKATADAKSSVIRKLHAQASNEGGDLAFKFLKLRHGGGLGVAGAGSRAGRDYEEQQREASSSDAMTDDEVLELINASINNARQAAEIKAREEIAPDPLRRE